MAYNYYFRRRSPRRRIWTSRRVFYTPMGIPYVIVNGRRQYLNR